MPVGHALLVALQAQAAGREDEVRESLQVLLCMHHHISHQLLRTGGSPQKMRVVWTANLR